MKMMYLYYIIMYIKIICLHSVYIIKVYNINLIKIFSFIYNINICYITAEYYLLYIPQPTTATGTTHSSSVILLH